MSVSSLLTALATSFSFKLKSVLSSYLLPHWQLQNPHSLSTCWGWKPLQLIGSNCVLIIQNLFAMQEKTGAESSWLMAGDSVAFASVQVTAHAPVLISRSFARVSAGCPHKDGVCGRPSRVCVNRVHRNYKPEVLHQKICHQGAEEGGPIMAKFNGNWVTDTAVPCPTFALTSREILQLVAKMQDYRNREPASRIWELVLHTSVAFRSFKSNQRSYQY